MEENMQKKTAIILFGVIFLVSCASLAPQPTATPVIQPTHTDIATQSPTPTETLEPTPTAVKASDLFIEESNSVTVVSSEKGVGIIEENVEEFASDIMEAVLAISCDQEMLLGYTEYARAKHDYEGKDFENWTEVAEFMRETGDYTWDTNSVGGIRALELQFTDGLSDFTGVRGNPIILDKPVFLDKPVVQILDYKNFQKAKEQNKFDASKLFAIAHSPSIYKAIRVGFDYALNDEGTAYTPTILVAQTEDRTGFGFPGEDSNITQSNVDTLNRYISSMLLSIRSMSMNPPVPEVKGGRVAWQEKDFADWVLVYEAYSLVGKEIPDSPQVILKLAE
jgi:hypothetical protein